MPVIEDWYDFEEEEDYEFYDALDTHVPDADTNSEKKVTMIKDKNDWLSKEIQDEVRKLEQLANQLDEVVKPEMKAEPEILEWETQHIGQFEMDLKPLEIESAEQSTRISSRSPTSVAATSLPTKAVPDIIPPKQPPPVRDKSRNMCDVRGCKRHFRGCQSWRDHSGPCEGVLDIGYLLIRPRARIRVHEPLRYPFMGPLWVYAPAGQYGKHMGRQACRAGDKLAMGPLRGLGVPANIICIRIWGSDGLGWPSHFLPTH